MPAQVVVVFHDPKITEELAYAIRSNGHVVQPFTDPMLALNALEQAQKVELLITCVQFSAGKPNGRSLALMARRKRPGIKCMFLTRPGEDQHVRDLGECVSLSTHIPSLAGMADALLGSVSTESSA